MPRRLPPPLALHPLLFALLLLAPAAARATWSHDPNVNNLIGLDGATGFFSGDNRACTDGAGGMFVVWASSSGSGHRVRVQHVLAGGTIAPGWPSDGLRACTTESDQRSVQLLRAATGDLLLAWADQRTGNYDIYAQRITPAGARMWGAGGLAVATTANDEQSPSLVTDGAGGCFVAWSLVFGPADHDVIAHHVLSNGTLDARWPAAVAVTSAEEVSPILVADASGGCWVSWYDRTNGVDYDVKLFHLTEAGVLVAGWPAVAQNPASGRTGNQYYQMMESDGRGGVFIVWQDLGSGDQDLYVAHYADGPGVTGGWVLGGTPVVVATGYQALVALCSDGSNGLYVLWSDPRYGGLAAFIQHLRLDGSLYPGWPQNGELLSPVYISKGALIADGTGGAIATWSEWTSGGFDAVAQRVLPGGALAPGWSSDAMPLGTALYEQIEPVGVADGAGGAMITWWDHRNGTTYEHYAQLIDRYGALGDARPAITAVRDVKPDQGGAVQLRWNAAYLDTLPTLPIGSYWVWRQVSLSAPAGAARATAAGAWIGDDDDAAALAAQGGRALAASRGGVAAASGYAWEYLGSQPANASATYSYVAPTVTDSSASGNPRTVFMVEAHGSPAARFWTSAPDSGYSVDNLAPPTPAPFAGTYSSGSTAMSWGPVTVADLAGYRLYRGTSLGFTPSPSNRIASPTTVLYTDAAGGPYIYKLTAVDVHGNESAPATLVPGGTAGVEDATPRTLDFAVAGANPSRGGATLRLALPSAGHVRVAVFDAQGRRVRTLIDGVREAGHFEARWDGTDASGARVGDGLYFARLEREGETRQAKVVMVR